MKIVDKMYDDHDIEHIHEQIRDVIEKYNQQGGKLLEPVASDYKRKLTRIEQPASAGGDIRKKLTRVELNQKTSDANNKTGKLLYSDFCRIVLDFQLKEHERFLCHFNDCFKQFDTNLDGVITEDNFKDLLQSMNVFVSEDPGQEIEYLLHQVDPFNNKQMTYSQVVYLLSQHTVPRDIENSAPIPILEKFFNDVQGTMMVEPDSQVEGNHQYDVEDTQD